MEVSLNQQQRRAVEHINGPMLVVAGAGTGKTSVIVERIIHLINSGVPLESILALTFTEKAATEMQDRVTNRLGSGYGLDMHIATFNSFGSDLLKEFAPEIGLDSSPRLIGDQGKLIVLQEHLDELKLDYFAPVSNPLGQLSTIADYLSLLKQQLVEPESYLEYARSLPEGDEADRLEKQKHTELAYAYDTYQKLCQRRNFIDYDDQIYLSVRMLKNRPNIRRALVQRFQHILVDEFQDTNPMQSKLIDLLVNDNQNIFAVGDDDQSIYGWRGATLANILEFTNRYPKTQLVTLTQNYRSHQEILDASYTLIQHNNPNRLEAMNDIDKKLQAHRSSGGTVQQKSFWNLGSEHDWIANDISHKIQAGVDPGQIAVLARRSAGVKAIHEILDAYGIEHTTVGVSSSLYDQPVVQSMVQVLRAIAEPGNDLALYHALCSPLFSLDTVTIGERYTYAKRHNQTLQQTIGEINDDTLNNALQQLTVWQQIASQVSVGTLAYTALNESGYKDTLLTLAETSPEGHVAAQSLFQWFNTLKEFQRTSEVSSVQSYLTMFETLKNDDQLLDDDTQFVDVSKPVIMTVHKAKGLEWQHVYVLDCTHQSFPLVSRGGSLQVPEELALNTAADDHYNEERRLMYVAMTRAKDSLTLTYSRTHNGKTHRKPSQFISEIFGEPIEVSQPQEEQQVSFDLFSQVPQNSLSLPQRFIQGNAIVLSVTQVDDFLRCPLDFYYRHILATPSKPSPHAAVGTLFHGIIQSIHQARKNGSSPPTKEVCLKRLTDDWPTADYISAEQRERALQHGLKSFDTLYETIMSGPIPTHIEQPFRVHIPNTQLILKGQVDAIFENGDFVEIRDYKTSIVKDDKSAKSRATSSKQLELYALAYRLQHDIMPSLLSLEFVLSGRVGSVKKQSKTLDKLEVTLQDAIQKILSNTFEPKGDHQYCRHPTIQ